jgi:hypothetical protein
MMNGTIEEKKETPLSEVLVREDWMNTVALDDMTEDQRMKLREFEAKDAKLKEEKEKIRKNLELELKKLKAEINDISNKFDDRVFILFRRRLEYEYRISEQELYIIRLTLSILMQEENNAKALNLEKLLKELYEKNEQLKRQKDILDEIKAQSDQEKEACEQAFKEAIQDKKNGQRLGAIYQTVFEADDKNKDSDNFMKDRT